MGTHYSNHGRSKAEEAWLPTPSLFPSQCLWKQLLAGLGLRKGWANGQHHPAGATYIPLQMSQQPFCRLAGHSHAVLDSFIPSDHPAAAKLYPRWMVLSLGESSLELLAVPVYRHPVWPDLQQLGINHLV